MKTKVFLSWSGERSHQVAIALNEWIPQVIQQVDPWISSVDIDKGAVWASELTEELTKNDIGIVCLTPENLSSPWLIFEAGAMSVALTTRRVCTYLYELAPADVAFPLANFQHTLANELDTRKLIHTINKHISAPEKLSEKVLNKAFNLAWKDLESSLASIPTNVPIPPKRSVEDMIGELVEIARETRYYTVMYTPPTFLPVNAGDVSNPLLINQPGAESNSINSNPIGFSNMNIRNQTNKTE